MATWWRCNGYLHAVVGPVAWRRASTCARKSVTRARPWAPGGTLLEILHSRTEVKHKEKNMRIGR
jgi:hypothetical protein